MTSTPTQRSLDVTQHPLSHPKAHTPLRSTLHSPLPSGPPSTIGSEGSSGGDATKALAYSGGDAKESTVAILRSSNGSAATRAISFRPSELLSIRVSTSNEKGKSQTGEDAGWHMRHGWDSQYSVEQLRELTTSFFMYFGEKRYETGGIPKKKTANANAQDWRMKDRLKTVSAVLPICLNIGVDPPDVFKTSPCAKLECWIDPSAASSTSGTNTAMHQIAKALQIQYESLSMRTRYKILSDPTSEELKKYCTTMRKNAKDERILFHFNGHGVPKPTPSGEIWVFNKNFTQYIPVSLFDLQSWLGAPSILVYDCINAGLIVKNFNRFVEKHHAQNLEDRRRDSATPVVNFGDCIQLAACGEDEMLPTNPMLPADLFTSCLTTPIDIAVRFYMMKSPLTKDYTLEEAGKIPGKPTERRTPLGELNWIFTAITDTIAWNTLPKPVFKRLFRQDLMVAALFRNFLLAQRIMRVYHCHPTSFPSIQSTHDHPLWNSWDLALELVLSQLPSLLLAEEKKIEYQYVHSDFFKDQLTAFEVYLDQGAREQREPEQLPIVLQVLLSQVHRMRALVLLSRFLDLGPWAVHLALGIGIFPYVLKLLQSQAQDLKPPLVFIWARVLAVDHECQSDLLKDNGYQYFVSLLNPAAGQYSDALMQLTISQLTNQGLPIATISEHRAMCCFIIAMFCKDHRQGQIVAHTPELVQNLLSYTSHHSTDNPSLRQWSILCLSSLWNGYTEAKWSGIRCGAYKELPETANDAVPEVRTAMVHAMGTFIGIPDLTPEIAAIEEDIALRMLPITKDSCSIVRKELTVFFSVFVARYMNKFVVTAAELAYEEVEAAILEDINEDEVSGETNGHVAPSADVATKNSFARSKSTNMLGVPQTGQQKRNMSGPSLVVQNIPQENGESPTPHPTPQNKGHVSPPVGLLNSQNVHRPRDETEKFSKDTIYAAVWMHVLVMAVDPDVQVSQNASIIVRAVIRKLVAEMGEAAQVILSYYQMHHPRPMPPETPKPTSRSQVQFDSQLTPEPVQSGKSDNYFAASLKRTASVAASIRNLAFGAPAHPPLQSTTHTPPRTPSIGSDHGEKPQTLGPSISEHDDGSSTSFGHARYPAPEWFEPIDPKADRSIPLKSPFFAYSIEYFREYQMKMHEDEEPGSRDYNQRLWRRSRNEKILEFTQKMKEEAGSSRWDHQAGYFNSGAQPTVMAFHQYENHLVIADDRDNIRVWDWELQKPLNRFSNGNTFGTSITALRLINEDDEALLMTGSSDGAVRVFRHYDDGKHTQVLSAFNALPKPDPIANNNTLVLDWLQGRGQILGAGDAKSIRVWSASVEMLHSEIRLVPSSDIGPMPTSNGCVTSLTSDQVEGNIMICGFDNGAIRVYDQRMNPLNALVKTWHEHKTRIMNVHLQRGGQRELVSASDDGVVKLWDLRSVPSLKTIPSIKEGFKLRKLSVHEHAPVFAVGSDRHRIKVFNMDGGFLSSFEPLTLLRHHTSNQRLSSIAATMFHPHKMVLACSSTGDSYVTLYSCQEKRRERDGGRGGEKIGDGVVEGF